MTHTKTLKIGIVIRRLQAVHLVVDDISSRAKEAAMSDYEPSVEVFSTLVEKLISEYSKEYDRYQLDEIVVAAIAPTVSLLLQVSLIVKYVDCLFVSSDG